jgi:XTP/dITP diphosphohydrolase
MDKILIATKNQGKVNDFKVLFEPKGIKVISLLELNSIEDVEETGTTFSENATLNQKRLPHY